MVLDIYIYYHKKLNYTITYDFLSKSINTTDKQNKKEVQSNDDYIQKQPKRDSLISKIISYLVETDLMKLELCMTKLIVSDSVSNELRGIDLEGFSIKFRLSSFIFATNDHSNYNLFKTAMPPGKVALWQSSSHIINEATRLFGYNNDTPPNEFKSDLLRLINKYSKYNQIYYRDQIAKLRTQKHEEISIHLIYDEDADNVNRILKDNHIVGIFNLSNSIYSPVKIITEDQTILNKCDGDILTSKFIDRIAKRCRKGRSIEL